MSPTGIWLNKHMEILLGKKKDAFALPFFFFFKVPDLEHKVWHGLQSLSEIPVSAPLPPGDSCS